MDAAGCRTLNDTVGASETGRRILGLQKFCTNVYNLILKGSFMEEV